MIFRRGASTIEWKTSLYASRFDTCCRTMRILPRDCEKASKRSTSRFCLSLPVCQISGAPRVSLWSCQLDGVEVHEGSALLLRIT